jgi:hypothetical protein
MCNRIAKDGEPGGTWFVIQHQSAKDHAVAGEIICLEDGWHVR